jgi:RND family efflux transporter MFP subunit
MFNSLTKRKLALVVISGALTLSACSKQEVVEQEAVKLVKAIKVNDVDDFEQRYFAGRIKGENEINLMFRVGGPLVKLPIKVGDQVNAGDILAEIDPQDYQVKVNQLQGELAAAKAAKELAIREYQRAVKMHKKDPLLISEAVLDQRKANVDSAAGQVIALEAGLQSAEDSLSYTQLKAPFSGRIVSTNVDNFEYVMPQQPIVKIVSLENLEVTIDVPENLISLTQAVENIEVSFPSMPGVKTKGYITEIGSEASYRTRTYPVTLSIEKPQGIELFAGMSVSVAGRVDRSKLDSQRSVELPIASVFKKQGKEYVWRVNARSELEAVEVISDKLTQHGIRVVGGLHSGDSVVIAGTKYLAQGDKVELLPAHKLMR